MRSFFVKEQRMKKTDTTKKRQEKHKGFIKKIGNTTYDVSFHYSRQSRESMNDKIIRLIENDMQGIKKN
jgi:sorbitol-specific phosphotransferase system component IIBC